MAKAVNGMVKTIGFIVTQIVYSIGLYLCSLVISCAVSGIGLSVFQAMRGFFPCILLWKWLLIGSVPLWLPSQHKGMENTSQQKINKASQMRGFSFIEALLKELQKE